ncbi:folate-binding protein YgfZ [Arcanobacterium pluranimalium]|uniref:CAF17-like 4Fe-4S cluster assembly/insertion protein YgfZ n=1 Tax=Arcanobacterium pluranimalium TaxID=108028 RepID=UPI0019565C73|nr:folate-binding protein YgfZ [Arcanobacterium pluranimalium]MBM7824192.1 folate-binding protein YgfZ [Arcanobacterium pluranimalium]
MYSLLKGAVLDDDAGVPAHFGNPFAEEEALRSGRTLTDLSLLEVVTVTGADRKNWLHNLSTCPFNDMLPGESREMLILDPHGHIEHAAAVTDDGESIWLITDIGKAQPLIDFLESMKFMLRVEIKAVPAVVLGLAISASELQASVREAALITWQDPWPHTLPGGAHYGIADDAHPARNAKRTLLVLPPERAPGVVEKLLQEGMMPAGLLAWEAARIVDRRPRLALDGADSPLPHELDWIRTAVHLNKGCYRGQETVAKLVNLGRPPRRFTYLYLEGPEGDLPAPGTEVFRGERRVGVLTSVARDFEEGPVGLALIKRSTPVSDQLRVGDFVAVQEEIVSAEGKSSVSPQERPGSELRKGAK